MSSTICYITADDFDTFEKARRLFAEHQYPIECFQSPEGPQGCDMLARELIEGGTRIFIARGGQAIRLQGLLPALVIPLYYDFFDFYKPIMQACHVTDRVAVAGWFEHLFLFREYKKIFPDNVRYYEFAKTQAPSFFIVQEAVSQMKRDGIQCVVGGSTVTKEARRQGMQTLRVEVSQEALFQAAREAIDYARVLKENEIWQNTSDTILSNVHEGYIFCTPDGKVIKINAIAENMLHIRERQKERPLTLQKLGLEESVLAPLLCAGKLVNKTVSSGGARLLFNGNAILSNNRIVRLLLTVESLNSVRSMENSLRKGIIKSGYYARYSFSDIVGKSAALRTAVETAKLYAESASTVLITGESGTGKELFAQSLHQASPRRQGPFVAINCAALPEDILESELFGYVKGAFTGARNEGKAGVFELADKGTIFLDEIGEVSLKLQAKLLRVLQEKEITRVGDSRTISVDVRVVAATNRNLMEAVRDKSFREDLFYRICVLLLALPPLRQRKEDIPFLLEKLLEKKGRPGCRFSDAAMQTLLAYDWPGNVREVENFVERLIILEKGPFFEYAIVQRAMLQPGEELLPAACTEEDPDERILQTLRACMGNRQETARRLGISRNTLWRRLKEIEARRGKLA
ncbi:MAG: sigma 54-interacting transcriptional regulator [Lachnospiraceae bacterium]|nr:sigma 54-interacting transcriptional regulator [Lachnospiraceae bacterium]